MHSMTSAAFQSPDTLDGVAGRVIVPDDPAYDQARTVFYGGIDKRPAAIVRGATVSEVQRVRSEDVRAPAVLTQPREGPDGRRQVPVAMLAPRDVRLAVPIG